MNSPNVLLSFKEPRVSAKKGFRLQGLFYSAHVDQCRFFKCLAASGASGCYRFIFKDVGASFSILIG